jgi:hypothetical protein
LGYSITLLLEALLFGFCGWVDGGPSDSSMTTANGGGIALYYQFVGPTVAMVGGMITARYVCSIIIHYGLEERCTCFTNCWCPTSNSNRRKSNTTSTPQAADCDKCCTCKQVSATAFVALLYFDDITQQSTLINRYTGGGSERGGMYEF